MGLSPELDGKQAEEGTMNARRKGVIAGMSGFFAGALSSHLVTWQPLPKACLAALVCATVTVVIFLVLKKRA